MAAEQYFIYSGGGRDVIPDDATHVSIHGSVTVIPAMLFRKHPNIVELICHDGVERIEAWAFSTCPRLERVIIPGVKVVEIGAFNTCVAVTYVECRKMQSIGESAFNGCISLSSINLPSAKVIDGFAFEYCYALTNAKFGMELESVEEKAFQKCQSLERITIPLKRCANLKGTDLAEGAVLHKTITALLLEDWRKDMTEEIDSINNILPNADPGEYTDHLDDVGQKALAIGYWIVVVLSKIIRYKAEHRSLLTEAASTLQLAFPKDIVTNSVIPFLELPLHTFEGEE